MSKMAPPKGNPPRAWNVLRSGLAVACALAIIAASRPASPEEIQTIDVTIRAHQFSPAEIRVKSGQPTILRLKNEDATPEEFDSIALKVEKVIPGGGSASVRLRPLGPGRYPFQGEYHPDTAQGVVIAQ